MPWRAWKSNAWMVVAFVHDNSSQSIKQMKARRDLSTAAWYVGLESFAIPPLLSRQTTAGLRKFVQKKKKRRGQKKEKSPTRLLSRKSSRAPLEERARASRKSSFLRNLRLFEQAESRTTHELDYVKCEKRAGSETK
jgi:hypothetical protein